MARRESIALGGYYPTPEGVNPLLANLMTAEEGQAYTYLDPCAGDGAAVIELSSILHDKSKVVSIHTIELETSRYKTLRDMLGYRATQTSLQGDAFQARFEMSPDNGVSLLFLNPPYDTDPIHGRLEEKFLSRFTATLAPRGILVFLVPFYALKASAATLAKEFKDVRCFRFPEGEFNVYKQVALFAEKRPTALWAPDPSIEAEVLSWAGNADTIPELPTRKAPLYEIPAHSQYARPFNVWTMEKVDFTSLLSKVTPWGQTDKGGKSSTIPGIMPEGVIEDLLVRTYPVAMPPRPAHIAAGIAAGVFNGARISPDKAGSKLPSLLVKGVFDKEFRTVEEKTDKEGNVKGLIQIQQPKLVTTALDLSTSTYVTIKPSTDTTTAETVEGLTMADLLQNYGEGLMNVMLKQCPVLHDPKRPEDAIELPTLARPLYEAQKHAVMGAVKLLGGIKASKRQRRYKSAFVLGEIGSGKTSVALATTMAIQAKRILVMCPPHLLTSWGDQIKAVTPWVRSVVLSSIEDVIALEADKDPSPVVAILSREAAKLGHAYESVTRCGGCGTVPPDGDHAKKRSRCEHRTLVAKNPIGKAIFGLARGLLNVYPKSPELNQLVSGPQVKVLKGREVTAESTLLAWDAIEDQKLVDTLLDLVVESEFTETTSKIILSLVMANLSDERTLRAVFGLYEKGLPKNYWDNPQHLILARTLLLLVQPEKARAAQALLKSREDGALEAPRSHSPYGSNHWSSFEPMLCYLWEDGPVHYSHYDYEVKKVDGKITVNKRTVGNKDLYLDAILLGANANIRRTEECGEPLFQAVPTPRRFPLATYIAKHQPDLFDLLILDEGHEYATDGSAQERSAHRLTSLGLPTLLLTGTIMNGYAESLFTNTWALSADFRREFAREDRTRFVDRFGYRKRLVEECDKEGKVVEYGTMSDRVERRERTIGDAPGVLPLFLLRYLLPLAVTLHKTDLKIDIPPCSEVVEKVKATSDLDKNMSSLQDVLLRRIKEDRFKPELAGKLWGAMAELPSYFDLASADVGNTESGDYEIRYPESAGGGVIMTMKGLDPSIILPKEEWLLAEVEKSLAAGRNVMVFAWHTKLLPRLSRLIEERTGKKAPILHPSKVPTAKRETWINKEIVAKKHRILIVNPVTVQTGLNNLVYFADQVWMENPACNPVTYRQAVGRVDRIGQKLPTNIVFPLYQGSTQETLHSLLLQKVAVSLSTDGLDAESALQAAGVGDDSGFSSFAVGRQLYEILARDSIYEAA